MQDGGRLENFTAYVTREFVRTAGEIVRGAVRVVRESVAVKCAVKASDDNARIPSHFSRYLAIKSRRGLLRAG